MPVRSLRAMTRDASKRPPPRATNHSRRLPSREPITTRHRNLRTPRHRVAAPRQDPSDTRVLFDWENHHEKSEEEAVSRASSKPERCNAVKADLPRNDYTP